MEPLTAFLISVAGAGFLVGLYKFLEMKEQKREQTTDNTTNHYED
ncbi:hypothetical protein [Shimazuella kribbensis]|nr:hypothetical protein [Shimazuella kribbensis]